MTSPFRASQSIERTNERTDGKIRTRTSRRAKKRNETSAPSARVSASTDGTYVGRLALQSVHIHILFTHTINAQVFFARFSHTAVTTKRSERSERTNAAGRMNSDEERSDENVKQEVKPENHLNIKVRDTVRRISRRRVVD